MKKSEAREWKSHPATKEAVKEAEERSDEMMQEILQSLENRDDVGRLRYLAGIITGLTLAFNPREEEDEE